MFDMTEETDVDTEALEKEAPQAVVILGPIDDGVVTQKDINQLLDHHRDMYFDKAGGIGRVYGDARTESGKFIQTWSKERGYEWVQHDMLFEGDFHKINEAINGKKWKPQMGITITNCTETYALWVIMSAYRIPCAAVINASEEPFDGYDPASAKIFRTHR